MAESSKRQRRPAVRLVDDTGCGMGARQGGTRSQVPRGSDSSASTGISGVPGGSMQTMAELLAPPSSAVATTLATDVVEFRRLPVAILRAVHTVCMDDRQRQQDFLSGAGGSAGGIGTAAEVSQVVVDGLELLDEPAGFWACRDTMSIDLCPALENRWRAGLADVFRAVHSRETAQNFLLMVSLRESL